MIGKFGCVLAACVVSVRSSEGSEFEHGAFHPITLLNGEYAYNQTCVAGEWKDYAFTVSTADLDNNMLLAVFEEGEHFNPEALSLHAFPGSIPVDRETALCSLRSAHREWAIEINQWDLKATTYYAAVRCGSEGANFRIIALLAHAELTLEEDVEGVVCPNQWVYHYFDSDDGADHADGDHLVFAINKTNEASTVTTALRHLKPPVSLAPPYATMRFEDAYNVSSMCHGGALSGRKYIGLLGGGECTTYTVRVERTHSCAPVTTMEASKQQALELSPNHLLEQTCNPHETLSFWVNIQTESAGLELVVVEATAESNNPTALSVTLSMTAAADDGRALSSSYGARSRGGGNTWTVGVGVDQIRKGRYYATVKCAATAVRFRVLARTTEAQVAPGETFYGQLCGGMRRFYFAQFNGTILLDPAEGEHRRLSGDESTASDATTASAGGYVTFTVRRLSGDLYVKVHELSAPAEMGPPYKHLQSGHEDTVAMSLCTLHEGKQWLMLQEGGGGAGCATFSMEVTYSEGGGGAPACTEIVHNHEAIVEASPILVGVPVLGRCTAHSWADFVLEVSEKQLRNNIVFKVIADASDGGQNPNALSVHLYTDSMPVDRTTQASVYEQSAAFTYTLVKTYLGKSV
jgi:hypothetical protein